MNAFYYIVTEGVHDVAFIGRLLRVAKGAKRIKRLESLEKPFKDWLESTFKWPLLVTSDDDKEYHDIERLAVPAPVLYQLATSEVLVLRNAQGITKIRDKLEVDREVFARMQKDPDAIGVILDSDDKPATDRFDEMKATFLSLEIPAPEALGEVSAGTPRVGVFALPQPGVAGTLEDILLKLGDVAYPGLTEAARVYADHWRREADVEPRASDWKEIRHPAGPKKATIGAMTAVLKPGKSTQVSLEDNRWVSDQTKDLACLKPCLAFLNALLATPAPAVETAVKIPEAAT